MNNLVGNFKTLLILVLFGIILFMRFCSGKKAPCPEVVKQTIDTAYLHKQWASEWKKPNPDTVIYQVPARRPAPVVIYRDTDPVTVVEPVDTAAILQDYYSKVVYRDTAGTEYGDIMVEDTISQNRIQARKWSTNFTIPVVTKTVTLVEKRNQLYAGFGLLGNDHDLISGARVSLTLKNKRDQQYEVSGLLIGGQWHVGLDTKFKISFR